MTDRQEATAAAFDDPRVGDRFHDFYSFWVYVVDTGAESVTTLEASPPCTFPDDGKLRSFASRAEYRKHYAYSSIPGYWVTLCDRGNDVTGWVSKVTAQNAVTAGSSSVQGEEQT